MKIAQFCAALPAAILIASTALGQSCPRPSGCVPMGTYSRMDTCEEIYYQNSIWPQQYIGPARRGICSAFETMTANGWRSHNLLGKYHFDPKGSGELSEAGRLKTEWILTQAPPHRRSIFVQRTSDAQQTAQRVESVQQFAANLGDVTQPVDVQETNIEDYGHPASAIDAVFTGYQANRPAPMLPAAASSSTSGQAGQ